MKKIQTIFILSTTVCLLVGCSMLEDAAIQPIYDIKNPDLMGPSNTAVSRDASLLDLFMDRQPKVSETDFPFNLYLWQSAVRVAAAAGIREISPETGVIVSEWFGDNESSFETQMTITISGAALTSTGVRVDTVRRNKTDNQKSFPGSNVVSAKLKDAILLGARELRRNVSGS